MESNIDNIFKEKISPIDKKPMDWNKEESWILIQSQKRKYTLKKFLKYAAMLAFVLGSTLITIHFLLNQDHQEHEIISRQEKYKKLEFIEQRLSQENGSSTICYTCFNPYLKTGTKPQENGFRVDIYY